MFHCQILYDNSVWWFCLHYKTILISYKIRPNSIGDYGNSVRSKFAEENSRKNTIKSYTLKNRKSEASKIRVVKLSSSQSLEQRKPQ